jgi:hypothetical protein
MVVRHNAVYVARAAKHGGQCLGVKRIWMNEQRENQRTARRVNFKRWFHIHIWSALVSLVLLLMLVVTGMLIYPLDQLGLRDIPLRSLWLPSL